MERLKVIVIISVTSDIGTALATRYAKEGHTVIGTYRSVENLEQVRNIPKIKLFPLDLMKRNQIDDFIQNFLKLGLYWDTFITLPCTPIPLKAFFDCDFDEWSNSIHLNAIEQLRVLHKIYPYRNKDRIVDIIMTAGGGVNNAVLNFSAYTLAKIMLIKATELLDAENNNINIFIVGPGWTKTKTHYVTLASVPYDSRKYKETKNFMENEEGTSMDDIYQCVKWLSEQGKTVASGRNFSVVNDKWHGKLNKDLAKALRNNNDMYKLRRNCNDYLT